MNHLQGTRDQERCDMDHHRSSLPAWRRPYAVCALAFLLAISGGCGKDSNPNTVVSGVIVEPNQKLSTAPHLFDVYRAEDADKAIVFLHGGAGTNYFFAYQLGLKRDPVGSNYAVADGRVLVDNKAIAVFPQGQAIAAAPVSYTWNNYVMDSGQDDMQFIRDLVSHIAARYNVTKFYVVGHSNGAMMINRIWCEEPGLFDAYVSIAGPPSVHFSDGQTPCSPTTVKPILNIVGAQDDVLQNADWEAQVWTINPVLAASPSFVDPDLIGERYFFPTRVTLRCGGTVQAGDADAVSDGATATWTFCNGSIRLIRIESAEHSVESLESASGFSLLDLVFDFISQNG
jgi:predicted esterase